MDQRDSFSQQSDFGCFSQQWSGKCEKAHRFPAKTRGKGLEKSESSMLGRHGQSHRNRAEHMPCSISSDDNEEAETNTAQSSKNLLDSDRANEINEQRCPEQKRNRLQPGD